MQVFWKPKEDLFFVNQWYFWYNKNDNITRYDFSCLDHLSLQEWWELKNVHKLCVLNMKYILQKTKKKDPFLNDY